MSKYAVINYSLSLFAGPPNPVLMLNVCQTKLQKKSPLKSSIEKGEGRETKEW